MLFHSNYRTLDTWLKLTGAKELRSGNQFMLDVPKVRKNKYGASWFSYAAATLWSVIYDFRSYNLEHFDHFDKNIECLFFPVHTVMCEHRRRHTLKRNAYN